MVAPSEGSSSEKGRSLQRYLLSFSLAAAAAQMGTAVWRRHNPPSRDSDLGAVASSEFVYSDGHAHRSNRQALADQTYISNVWWSLVPPDALRHAPGGAQNSHHDPYITSILNPCCGKSVKGSYVWQSPPRRAMWWRQSCRLTFAPDMA